VVPNSGESGEDRQELADLYRRQRAVALYDMQVYVPIDDAVERGYLDDTFVRTALYRFEDDEAAATWVEEAPGTASPDTPPLTSLAPLGDGVSGFELTHVRGTVEPVSASGYTLYVRVGSEVALVQVAKPAGIDLADVEALAAMQVECLVARSCPTTIPVPPPFLTPSGS
jgi:hypothetical protein